MFKVFSTQSVGVNVGSLAGSLVQPCNVSGVSCYSILLFFHILSDPHAISEQAKVFQLVPLSARSMFNCTLESCPISLVYVEGCLYSGCWC